MVALGSLEASVLVQIQVGQPVISGNVFIFLMDGVRGVGSLILVGKAVSFFLHSTPEACIVLFAVAVERPRAVLLETTRLVFKFSPTRKRCE